MKSIFAALVLMFIVACNDKPVAVTTEQGRTIEYFPRENIYYDVDRKNYIVFSSDKRQWETVEALPGDMQDNLGKKVQLSEPPVPVYRKNAEHRLVYSAALYHSADKYRQKFIEDSIALAPKRTVTVKRSEDDSGKYEEGDKKKKKGRLKKFFERIF